MRIAGVIAEYDPFHAGHAWQLDRLRALGFDRVVVCMSSWAVQRGGLPLLPPSVRARAALEAGADLVLALPAPWACQSAEGFAAAGVALLEGLGCVDALAFGAETADRAALLDAARALRSAEYAAVLKEALAGGAPFAAARAAAADRLCPGAGALLATPNNNLGVEYCKALLGQGAAMEPLPLPRRGAAHGAAGEREGFASASWIRRRVAMRGIGGARGLVPPAAFALYEAAAARGLLTSPRAFDLALLSRLRALPAGELAAIRGVNEGLEHRLAAAVRAAPTARAVYDGAKTRRYAHARLRRLALDAALGYRAGALPALPPYLHVLAARREALGLCAGAKLPCSPSLARLARASAACAAAAAAECAAADFAALCRAVPGPMGEALAAAPALLGADGPSDESEGPIVNKM